MKEDHSLAVVNSGTAESLALQARISAVRMCGTARAAHIGSALSVIDILSVLYSGSAAISPYAIEDPRRDIIILSKGHAAAGLYAVLANAGYFPLSWLASYCADGSRLGGHVTRGSIPGVELSTGSLGHGLPFGAGIALRRFRLRNPGRVFVVLSDGECDEGTTWETALFAAHHELGNLTVLIDRNGIQSLDTTENTLQLEPLAAKWEAFGWRAATVDGHDHSAIAAAIHEADHEVFPSVLICSTTKGKGVSFMEDEVLWHYRSPTDEHLDRALFELQGND